MFIASIVASCNTNNSFRRRDFQSAEEKNQQTLNVFFFSPKPQKFHTTAMTSYMVINDTVINMDVFV